jgi:uncharacterized membrane protein YjdF
MITKAQFEEAYRKFPPSKFELFFLKYVSIHSLRENKWILIILPLFLTLPLISCTISCYLDLLPIYKEISSAIYILLLTFFGIHWFLVTLKKKNRLEKVRKYLGITKEEFQDLINAHFYHRYPNAEKYIKYNSH